MAFADELSSFAAAAATKLKPGLGEPEDQIRGPFEQLLTLAGFDLAGGFAVNPIGETALAEERIRPDYAVLIGKNPIPIGFVELKAPGVGADTSRFKGRNREQFERLSALPNVLYTDGNDWSLYRMGEVARSAKASGNIRKGRLADPNGEIEGLLADFLNWEPEAPKNTGQLVRSIAGLTRLLRDEVLELCGSGGALDDLAADWRSLLFPEATDAEFADGFAQTVTFGLLLARAEGIDFTARDLSEIARLLGKQHSLMGKALAVLTEEDLIGKLYTSVMTLVRVVGAVDWDNIRDRGGEPWLRFYEDFLEAYDNELRKRSGSYYTPSEVVAAMVRLTDELLRTRLGIAEGFASENVTVVDPAMGTGTFLLEVIRQTARTITELEGPGAVGPRLRTLSKRLIGFEKQLGPYAVSELRAFAEFHAQGSEAPADGLRMYVTDTLADPYIEIGKLAATYEPIAKSRREANRVKAEEPVTVVIGNPPYKDRAGGLGGWVEQGNPEYGSPGLLADFVPPKSWGLGAHAKTLYNLYVYFWRWAMWKTFEVHPGSDKGVVAFITTSAWTDGPGFAAMRARMRDEADEIWVIDLTPEGHQPPVNTRVFPGVQQPLAITLLVRSGVKPPGTPAKVRRTSIPGLRAEKYRSLKALRLEGDAWSECLTDPQSPFQPATSAAWQRLPLLGDLVPWTSPGVMASRTWPISSTPSVLEERWTALIGLPPEERAQAMKETPSTTVVSTPPSLVGVGDTLRSIFAETDAVIQPRRYSFRPLDRSWLIPDSRLIHRPRRELWVADSPHQIYAFELHSEAVTDGPAIVFHPDIPDNHAFRGSFGGRALPLWRDSQALEPNLAPGLLELLATTYGLAVTPEDVFAYLAAICGSPSFTHRFREDLATPGVRVPLTRSRDVWEKSVEVGQRAISLWTYGRKLGVGTAERMPAGLQPKVLRAIPDTVEQMPADVSYDREQKSVHLGDGTIGPVSAQVWDYQISGYRVVQRWIKRRLKEPEGKRSSPLDEIVPTSWTPAMTTELLELLNAVGCLVALEPLQEELLDEVLSDDLITVEDLTTAGVLPIPDAARKARKAALDTLFDG